MTELLGVSWKTLLIACVVFGFAPRLCLRLLLRLYPPGDARRAELMAELKVVPRWERPFWVSEQLETALSEAPVRRRRVAAARSEAERLHREVRAQRRFSAVMAFFMVGVAISGLTALVRDRDWVTGFDGIMGVGFLVGLAAMEVTVRVVRRRALRS